MGNFFEENFFIFNWAKDESSEVNPTFDSDEKKTVTISPDSPDDDIGDPGKFSYEMNLNNLCLKSFDLGNPHLNSMVDENSYISV